MAIALLVRMLVLVARACTHTLLDIFLVCDDSSSQKSFQIWVNNKDSGYSLAQSGKLPSGTQSVTFADIGALNFTTSVEYS